MRTATTNRYGLVASGVALRAHMGSSSWTTFHVLSGMKPFAIQETTAHQRSPEVLPT